MEEKNGAAFSKAADSVNSTTTPQNQAQEKIYRSPFQVSIEKLPKL
jgi:hypothetical protein